MSTHCVTCESFCELSPDAKNVSYFFKVLAPPCNVKLDCHGRDIVYWLFFFQRIFNKPVMATFECCFKSTMLVL